MSKPFVKETSGKWDVFVVVLTERFMGDQLETNVQRAEMIVSNRHIGTELLNVSIGSIGSKFWRLHAAYVKSPIFETHQIKPGCQPQIRCRDFWFFDQRHQSTETEKTTSGTTPYPTIPTNAYIFARKPFGHLKMSWGAKELIVFTFLVAVHLLKGVTVSPLWIHPEVSTNPSESPTKKHNCY